MRFLDLLAIRRRERPGATALVDATTGRRVSYEDLSAHVERSAAALAAGGPGWPAITPGDRVAFYAGSSPELVIAHLAVLTLGGVAVPINLAYREREIGHILGDALPRLVVVDSDGGERIAAVEPEQRRSVEAVVPAAALAAAEGAPASRPAGAPLPEAALLVYTSGTTGASKGAVLTHDNLLATVTGLLAAWAWRPEDVLLLALPLFHVHGLVVGLHTALAAGATVRLHRRFDAARVAEELAAGEASLFFGVPTMYVRLIEEIRRRGLGPEAFSRLRLLCSGSAPLAAETFEAFREATGHEILERYGMTEAGMILSNPYAGPRVPGTVGTPLPGVSVRVVDRETGENLAPGETGELLVRGSNVFAGYRNAPEKTAESFVADRQGRRWFRTGDLARQNPETGCYTLLGRRHELILRGGLNVYPREIEEVLEGLPGVAEAAVAGRPDPEYGEVPVAYVVPERGEDGGAASGVIDPEAILAGCRERLASFKVPVAVRVVDGLPRNALGKVQKHRLPR